MFVRAVAAYHAPVIEGTTVRASDGLLDWDYWFEGFNTPTYPDKSFLYTQHDGTEDVAVSEYRIEVPTDVWARFVSGDPTGVHHFVDDLEFNRHWEGATVVRQNQVAVEFQKAIASLKVAA